MQWLKDAILFFSAHLWISAILIGLFVGWAATFLLETKFIPDAWPQGKCEAVAIASSILIGFAYTYGFWHFFLPDDKRGFVFLAASAASIGQHFFYWALSKLIGWKFPGLDLTFGPKHKEPPT